jgi:hypothetical protein
MLTHMLVQIPLLLLAGMAMAVFMERATVGSMKACADLLPSQSNASPRWNAHGLTGLFYALVTLGFWMTPVALDHAVASAGWDIAKAVSLLAAGSALRKSWAQAGGIIQAFFVGNTVWMTVVVGILFQELPQRLCNAYLQDDQNDTGMIMVCAASVIGLFWTIRLAVQLHRESAEAVTNPGVITHEI